MCSTIQYKTEIQHNTIQHNTIQHNTTQHNTTQHNTTQHNTTQHNALSVLPSPISFDLICFQMNVDPENIISSFLNLNDNKTHHLFIYLFI